MTHKVVELFTGTGAFSLAFHSVDNAKFETVYANDFEPSSKIIFDANNTLELHCADLMTIEPNSIPAMDILTCGFPCQPFSIAGRQEGFHDKRSNVFWKILEVLDLHRPRIAILENVKNLEKHDHGTTFEIIAGSLEELGYHIKHAILNTCKITTIPQNRERIYIVCFRDEDDYNHFSFPSPLEDECKPVQQFLESDVKDKYYYTVEGEIWHRLEEGVTEHVNTNTVYQYRRYYVRENKSNVCPTLTANMGSGGHNVPIIKDDYGIRKLTPRECFNLQGFPDTYILPNGLSDAKLYKLAGNAVSVPVVKKIIEQLPV